MKCLSVPGQWGSEKPRAHGGRDGEPPRLTSMWLELRAEPDLPRVRVPHATPPLPALLLARGSADPSLRRL